MRSNLLMAGRATAFEKHAPFRGGRYTLRVRRLKTTEFATIRSRLKGTDGARGWTRPSSHLASFSAPGSPPAAAVPQTWQAVLNRAPSVQAVAQLKRALSQSPGVAQLTRLSAALQGTPNAPVQLMSARQDRERLREARQNRVRFLAILMVIAANIVNGNYALEDVDDLVEGPDHEILVDEVRRREVLRAERRAQGQQQRDQQRYERRRQHNQRGGYRHR